MSVRLLAARAEKMEENSDGANLVVLPQGLCCLLAAPRLCIKSHYDSVIIIIMINDCACNPIMIAWWNLQYICE